MKLFKFHSLRSRLTVAIASVLCLCAGTAQALTITNASPKGTVRDLTQITVRFSGNMKPLGVMDEQAGTAPLRLSASDGKLPAGSFRWLDPTTMAYIFDQPVMHPLRIRASVPKGTASLTREILDQDVTWEISTPALELSLDNQSETTLPRKDAAMRLVSNYPLNERLLREKSRLTINGKKLAFTLGKPETYEYRQGRPGAWLYAYKITNNLPKNRTVVLDIAEGLRAKDGGDPAPKASFNLPSYSDLQLKQWSIGEYGSEKKGKNPAPGNSLNLHFNNPIRLADLLKHISVTPKTYTQEMETYLNSRSEAESFSLPHRWKPRTKCTVTIRPGLTDRYGTSLKKQETITFTTGDYPPFILMPEGSLVLEPALAASFPLIARNAGVITAKLRYLPWISDAFRLLRQDLTAAALRNLASARESMIVVDTASSPNTPVRKYINIPSLFGFPPDGKNAGLVTVDLVPPEADGDIKRLYSRSGLKAKLQVTDLGVTARLGEKQGYAWIVGITSGKPVPEATVRLLDKDGEVLWRGQSNGSGLAIFPGLSSLSAMPRFCMAEKNDDAAVLDLAAAGIPKDKKEYQQQAALYEDWSVHAVSQLPLYQPGQTVNAVLYARRHTDKTKSKTLEYADWIPMAQETLMVTILDRNGKTVHAFEATANAYGSLPFSFTLAVDAEMGWYTVRAVRKDTDSQALAYPFQVASFRPSDFRVDITPPISEPIPAKKNARLQVGIAAGYFSGALLSEAPVTLAGEYRESYFKPVRLAGYTTGPGGRPPFRIHRLSNLDSSSVSGKLDKKGAATLSLPPVPESLFPLELSLTATVTDATNLASQGTASCLLHHSAWYIGLRSPFLAMRGEEFSITLKGASWDDKPLAGKPVSLKAEFVTWENNREIFKPVWEKKHTLKDETGDRLSLSFAESGAYRLTASISDDEGRKNLAVTRVYVPGPSLVWPATRQGSQLDLLVDEDQVYQPGDTAKLVINNPFDRAWALVALERDGVRRTLVREISGTDPVVEVPLEKADAPYVYASVSLVTGRTAPPPDLVSMTGANPEDAAKDETSPIHDDGGPALYQGGTFLRLADSKPELTVTLTTDAEEYRPGGTVMATAAVTEGGKGKKAQVTLLAVDERILRSAGERTAYDPFQTFRPLYPNKVHAADIWRFLLDYGQIEMYTAGLRNSAKMALPMAMKSSLDMTTAAGGLGDSPLIRSNLSPLAFWLAEGETDAGGLLKADFTLPDSITSYRIVAVAADLESGFANSQISVRAAKPLQLLSALPKFVTEGDKLEAGILIQNASNARREVAVTLTVTGPVKDSSQRRTSVILDAGQSSPVFFPLEIAMLTAPSGNINLLAEGRTEEDSDAVEFTLPVKPAKPMTIVAAAGMLDEGGEYIMPVKAPANLDLRSRMDVTFAPSPVAGIPLAAQQAIDYPWNCLEQRLSRAWARMTRLEYGDFIGLSPDAGDKNAVEEEFKAILSHQREDGSFTLWLGMEGSGDTGLNLFITAYALLVSDEGRNLALSLPDTVRDKALDYLEKTLSTILEPEGKTQLETRPDKDTYMPFPENIALALSVLARHRPFPAASLFPAVLDHCERDGTTPLGWGSLLLTMDALKNPDQPYSLNQTDIIPRILANLEKTAAITPTHVHFTSIHEDRHWMTLGSRLRDNAVVLAALTSVQKDYPRLEALAAWVGQRVGDTKVLTTQEAAFGLWGMVRYLRGLGGDKETFIRAVWNGQNEASASFSKLMNPPTSWSIFAHALNGGNASNLILRADTGRPYWTARLFYSSPDLPLKKENAGFTVHRSFSSKGPWKIRDIVEVTITVTVPATRRHVLLFDPFPAGFEPLYASRVDLMDRDKEKNAGRHYNPWQWQDAMDDGMLFYASTINAGTYTSTYSLRAAAAGTFIQRPSLVEEMYTPEVFGRTEAGKVIISNGL